MTNRITEQQNSSHAGESMARERDIVEALRADPGRFTLGELLQQREAALHEISRLRARIRQESLVPAVRADAMDRTARPNGDLHSPALRPGTLVSAKELKSILGVGSTTLYKMVSEGRFPKQTHFGSRTARWRSDDVIEWLGRLR